MKERRILITCRNRTQCENLNNTLSCNGHNIQSYTFEEMIAKKNFYSFRPQIVIIDEPEDEKMLSFIVNSTISDQSPCHIIVLETKKSYNHISEISGSSVRFLEKPFPTDRLVDSVNHCFEFLDLKIEKLNTEASLTKRNLELADINRRLRQIVESTKRLTSLNGKEELGPAMLQEFADNMNARGGSLFLHKGNELSLVYTLDRGQIPKRLPLPLSAQSVLGLVLITNEPVLIEDIRKEQQHLSSGHKGYSDPSLLVFPMMEKNGSIVGIITLHNKINPPFTLQDKELGTILASYGSETLRAAQAIEDLRQSEKKARTILDANPDPVIVYDNRKNVQYLNPSFSHVFGWNLSELSGRSMNQFIHHHEQDLDKLIDSMEKKGEGYSGLETVCYTKDGRLVPVSISGAPFSDSNGTILGSVRNIRDITEQKNLEEQIIQSQKMEAIGTLASGIAHDFNNILTAIFGNLDLAIMDIPEGMPVRHNIENIMKAADRAKDLVSQILAFSRKNEKTSDSRQIIMPHIILKEALALLRASIPSTIEIRDVITCKKSSIIADAIQFHQIIMNLCTNAHHAMKSEGGVLTVKLESINEPFEEKNNGTTAFVKLTVQDTGCGMDDSTLKRIFDPYFTTRSKELGTGLGLSVVRKIVGDCNGQISVFSTPGSGTRFELLFPESCETVQDREEAAPVPKKGSGVILYVDDEKDIVNLGVSLLQRLGYKVIPSTSPLEAVQIIRSNPHAFDVVITDMTMPKMTGTQLASTLRSIRPDLPIILCTGFNQSDFQDNHITEHIDAVLKKPVNLRVFSETISRLLNIKNHDNPHPEP